MVPLFKQLAKCVSSPHFQVLVAFKTQVNVPCYCSKKAQSLKRNYWKWNSVHNVLLGEKQKKVLLCNLLVLNYGKTKPLAEKGVYLEFEGRFYCPEVVYENQNN